MESTNRTVFAQRRLTPEDVLPEWEKQLKLIGDEHSILRFVRNACARLNSPLEKFRQAWRFLPQHLPQTLRERLAEAGVDSEIAIDFHYPPTSQTQFIHRTHPLVAILADFLLETALQEASPIASRCAATVTGSVEKITSIYLLRLRHQLTYRRYKKPRTLMAEETVAIALEGRHAPRWLDDAEVNRLLEVIPSGNLKDEPAQKEIQTALEFLQSNTERLEALATERAETLLQDHLRIREAARDIGEFEVSPCLPVDVIGTYVLLPDGL